MIKLKTFLLALLTHLISLSLTLLVALVCLIIIQSFDPPLWSRFVILTVPLAALMTFFDAMKSSKKER